MIIPTVAVTVWLSSKNTRSKPSNIYQIPRQMSTSPTTIAIFFAKYLRSFMQTVYQKKKNPAYAGFFSFGGPYRIRTCDPLIANEVLYQLS